MKLGAETKPKTTWSITITSPAMNTTPKWTSPAWPKSRSSVTTLVYKPHHNPHSSNGRLETNSNPQEKKPANESNPGGTDCLTVGLVNHDLRRSEDFLSKTGAEWSSV